MPHSVVVAILCLVSLFITTRSFAQDTNDTQDTNQVENFDELFLDDSFTSDDSSTSDDSPEAESSFDSSLETLIQDIPPEPFFEVSVENILNGRYNWLNRNSYFLDDCNSGNCDDPVFFAQYQFDNSIQADIQYRNAADWFLLRFIPRIYLEAKEPKTFNQLDDLSTFLGFEIDKAQLGFRFWNNIWHLNLGKFNRSISTTFLKNPADPEITRYTHLSLWRNHPDRLAFSTTKPKDTLSDMGGSEEDVGQWRVELGLLFSWISLYFSYLPAIDTTWNEFYRAHHAYQLTVIPKFNSDLSLGTTFYYANNDFFAGLSGSYGIGDEITMQFELSADSRTQIPTVETSDKINLGPATSVLSYTFGAVEAESALVFSSIVGASYTPKDLFTLLFEVSYNGKGFLPNEWNTQAGRLDDIVDTYRQLSLLDPAISPLSVAYSSLVAYYARAYDPMEAAPLYLLLRLSRADIFEKLWLQQIDADASLIYSPFDSNFLTEVNFTWLAKRIFELSLGYRAVFGSDNGVFTILPYKHSISLSSKWVF